MCKALTKCATVAQKKSIDFYNNDRDMFVFWSIHKIYIYTIYSDVHATVEAKICWKKYKSSVEGNTVQMTVP